jgi:DNA-binding NtrC family response regulator
LGKIFSGLAIYLELPGPIGFYAAMLDAGHDTILIVEDEVLIRIIAADALEESGFKVLEAGNATEALGILDDHDEVAVLFTDINMPGDMDGLALARHVSHQRPEIKVVVTSGKQWLDSSSLPDDGVFLPKPYRASQLAAAMAR